MAKVEMDMPDLPEGWAYTGEISDALQPEDYLSGNIGKICGPGGIYEGMSLVVPVRKLEPTPDVCSWREIGGAGSNFECGCDEDNPHSVRPLVAERMTYCPYCSLPIYLVDEEPEAVTWECRECEDGSEFRMGGHVCRTTISSTGNEGPGIIDAIGNAMVPEVCQSDGDAERCHWTRKDTP